jgi:hypothetical protein
MTDPVDMQKIINFILEFSAGLLQVAQSIHAIKILGIASQIIETAEKEEWSEEIKQENIANKENILILIGPCARQSPIIVVSTMVREAASTLSWDTTIGDH